MASRGWTHAPAGRQRAAWDDFKTDAPSGCQLLEQRFNCSMRIDKPERLNPERVHAAIPNRDQQAVECAFVPELS